MRLDFPPLVNHRLRIVWIILSAIAMILGAGACQRQVEPVSVGIELTAVNSLIYIAEDQGYFAANGLDVSINEYPSGLAAVDGLLNGEVDIATSSEFVVVGKALAKERIRAFGSIDKFTHNYLIGRRDRGIEAVSDLVGKKIGVPLKTAGEFYLGRFLDLQGIRYDQVTLVDVSPPRLVETLVNGEVDAVIAWQPNAEILVDRLGDGIVRWPVQNDQATYCSLVSTDSWTKSHPERVERFLKSLAQAEEYFTHNPVEAAAIIQKRLNYDGAYMDVILPEHQFQLSLDQSLILAMEDEARWMINNGLTGETQTPDFLSYLEIQGIEAVKPNAVNIIR